MRTARRLSQLLFLLLFLVLLFMARYPYAFGAPSDIFLRFDPLIAVSTALASRSLADFLWMSLILVVLTIVLGRLFCGWICPLGTTLDFTDRLFRRYSKRNTLKRFRPWKFGVLFFSLGAALASVQLIGFVDPIALMTRTFTLLIFPALTLLLNSIFNFLFQINMFPNAVYSVYSFAQQIVLPIQQPQFLQVLPTALIFLGIISLGAVSRRFWCRNLCPLGALLGLLSRYRLLGRVVDSGCIDCSRCAKQCRMNAIEDDFTETSPVECIECGECAHICPESSIRYRFRLPYSPAPLDVSKRYFLAAGTAGVAGALVLDVSKTTAQEHAVIRPPGAVNESDFLATCIRCQACVKICASAGNGLQPTLWQSGVNGLWSPMLEAQLGYCEYNCTLCGAVCPTGAIQKITLEAKQNLKIGRAWFDKDRCIPWAEHTDCLVCEEHCPVSEKAIKFDSRQVKTVAGNEKTIKLPYVVDELCVGCGICQFKCPVEGQPGIYVTAAGNERL